MNALSVAVLALVIGTQLVPVKSSRDPLGRPEIDWSAISECVLQPPVSTTGWQRQEFQNLSFLLPGDFKMTQSPIVFDHGGQMWRHGDRTISVIAGFWGPSSFDGWHGAGCRTDINRHPVLLMETVAPDRVTVRAWYQDQPLLEAHGKRRRDLTLLRTIVLSGVSK